MIRFIAVVTTLVALGCALFMGCVYLIAAYGWVGATVIVAWGLAAVGIVAFVNVGASAEGQGRRNIRAGKP